MAKAVHTCRPHDEVQAGGKQRSGEQIDRQHGGVGVAGGDRRQRQQGQAQHHGCRQQGLARRAQGWLYRRGVAGGRLGLAHQPPGPPHQHHRHHQKLGHQGELAEVEIDSEGGHIANAHAQRLDFGNQQCGHVSTRDAAHAAHHHHHEGVANGEQIQVERGRLTRQLQRAAQAGQHGAQCKHAGEQPGLVDAQRAHHLAVLGGGAHQRAPARAGEQQPQQTQHHRAHHDQQQVIGGKAPAQDVHAALQPRRTRAQQIFGTPKPQRRVLDHQHQREGGQQLKKFRRTVDAAQQQHLDCRADGAHRQRREQHGWPET